MAQSRGNTLMRKEGSQAISDIQKKMPSASQEARHRPNKDKKDADDPTPKRPSGSQEARHSLNEDKKGANDSAPKRPSGSQEARRSLNKDKSDADDSVPKLSLYAPVAYGAELCRIAEEAAQDSALPSTMLHTSLSHDADDVESKPMIASKQDFEFRLLRLPIDPMDVDGDALNGFSKASAPSEFLVRRNRKSGKEHRSTVQAVMDPVERRVLGILRRRGCSISEPEMRRLRRRMSIPWVSPHSRLMLVRVQEDWVPSMVDGVLLYNDERQVDEACIRGGVRKPCEGGCNCPMPVYVRKTLVFVSAVVSIQAAWRSFQVRRNLEPRFARRIVERRAILCIQRWWKTRLWRYKRAFLHGLSKLWSRVGKQLAQPMKEISIKLSLSALTRIQRYFLRPPAWSPLSRSFSVCFDEFNSIRVCQLSLQEPLFPQWMDVHFPVCTSYSKHPSWETGLPGSRERKTAVVRLLRNVFVKVDANPSTGKTTSATIQDKTTQFAFTTPARQDSSLKVDHNRDKVMEIMFQLETASHNGRPWEPVGDMISPVTGERLEIRNYVFMEYLLTWDPKDREGAEIEIIPSRPQVQRGELEKIYTIHSVEAAQPKRSTVMVPDAHHTDKEETHLPVLSPHDYQTYHYDNGVQRWRDFLAEVKKLARSRTTALLNKRHHDTQLARTQAACRSMAIADYERARLKTVGDASREEDTFLLQMMKFKRELKWLESINSVHNRQRQALYFRKKQQHERTALKDFIGKVNRLSKSLQRHGLHMNREMLEERHRARIRAEKFAISKVAMALASTAS